MITSQLWTVVFRLFVYVLLGMPLTHMRKDLQLNLVAFGRYNMTTLIHFLFTWSYGSTVNAEVDKTWEQA